MINQIAIGVMGPVATILSQSASATERKWSSIVGSSLQPFWFYTTFVNEQWGAFFACFFFTYGWCRGLYNNWWTPWRIRSINS